MSRTVATDLGVACGIAFSDDGTLFVGDRSGSILRVRDGRATMFATIPPSVAAFHLAFGPDRWLYVTAPTLGARDCVYRISPDGVVEVFYDGFGRPQGLAFDDHGDLYVVDAMAGFERSLPSLDGSARRGRAGRVGRLAHRPRLRSHRRVRSRLERYGVPVRPDPDGRATRLIPEAARGYASQSLAIRSRHASGTTLVPTGSDPNRLGSDPGRLITHFHEPTVPAQTHLRVAARGRPVAETGAGRRRPDHAGDRCGHRRRYFWRDRHGGRGSGRSERRGRPLRRRARARVLVSPARQPRARLRRSAMRSWRR